MTVRSALRIAVIPGRADRRRLIGMAAGVAVGVMLAALLWAGFTGLGDRSERSTWTDTFGLAHPVPWQDGTTLAADEVAARGTSTIFHARAIDVLQIAGAADTSVDIPGTSGGVAPGETWVSPALAALIEQYPSDELADRFGTIRGVLPDSVLAGPDALVAVVGVNDALVDESFIVASDFTGYRYVSETYEILALLGAVAVLIPVAMLLGVVTSFGSVDRTARMRAFHLLGATAADRARFAAAEAGGVALIGTIAGVLLAWLAAIPTSIVSLNGSRLFPDDLRLSFGESLVAVVVVPLAFASFAAVRAARVDAQPSSVRDREEKRLGWWRPVILVAGIAMLGAYFAGMLPTPMSLVAAFVVTAVGVVAVGPIITRAIARLAHKRAQSAAGVMAYARIHRNPRQIFRAVSGVVIAVFLVSLFMSGVTSVRDGVVTHGEGYLADDVLMVQLSNGLVTDVSPQAASERSAAAEQIADAVAAVPGVTGVARIYTTSDFETLSTRSELANVGIDAPGDVVSVDTMPYRTPVVRFMSDVPIDGAELTSLFVQTTDRAAQERVRTVLAASGTGQSFATTRAEFEQMDTSMAREYRTLAILGILVAAGVSAVALAAATISAVRDRRRTLGLLRLTGMPFSTVKGIMLREAVVPLAAAVVVAALVGYGVGALIVTGLSAGGRTVTVPPVEYFVVIAATLGLSLVAVLSAVPAARRATSGEVTRFE